MYPHLQDTGGFFVAVIKKVKEMPELAPELAPEVVAPEVVTPPAGIESKSK